jgi:hypothetical protein
MRFVRPSLAYAKIFRQRNVVIREKLKVQSISEEIKTYQKNWKEHVERIQEERLPKLAFKYKPDRERKRRRPKKRRNDQF